MRIQQVNFSDTDKKASIHRRFVPPRLFSGNIYVQKELFDRRKSARMMKRGLFFLTHLQFIVCL